MKKREKISAFAKLSFLIFAFSLIISFAAKQSVYAADYINSTLSDAVRRAMASFGDLFNFSLFELLVLSIPVLLVILICTIYRSMQRGELIRFTVSILALAALLYSGNAIALGVAYNTTPLSEKMELYEVEINAQSLGEVMTALRDEVNSLSDSVPRDESGVFVTEYDLDRISELAISEYGELASEYSLIEGFYSRAKGVSFKPLLSYLGLTGIYTFYTGEANVNTAYPSYDLIFTAAHELSHQRGILRENEANFMAYLICSRSDDISLKYSAALNMYQYIGSALYRTDKEMYYQIAEEISWQALADMRASYDVTEKYGDTVLADISSFVNDMFLKSNGTDGVVSYSQVVELAVAYFYR